MMNLSQPDPVQPKAVDYRDLVINQLAGDEQLLREQVAELVADRDSYRLVAEQFLHGLHHLIAERDRLLERYYRVLEQYRQLRESVMRREEAA